MNNVRKVQQSQPVRVDGSRAAPAFFGEPVALCDSMRKRRLSDILGGDTDQTVMSSDDKCKLFLALARPEESHRLSSPNRTFNFSSKYEQIKKERLSHTSEVSMPSKLMENRTIINSTSAIAADFVCWKRKPLWNLWQGTKSTAVSRVLPNVGIGNVTDTTRHRLINNVSLVTLPHINDADAARQSRDCVVAFTENGPIRVTAGSMPPSLLHQLAPPRNIMQTRPHPLHTRLAQQQERMREARRIADRPPSIVTPAEIELFNEMVKFNPSILSARSSFESPRRLIQEVLEQPLTKVPVGFNTAKIIERAVSDCFLMSFALYKQQIDLSSRKLDIIGKCIICYQEFDNSDEIAMLPCVPNHIIHSNCLQAWLKQKLQCPFCRADFPSAKTESIGQGLGIL